MKTIIPMFHHVRWANARILEAITEAQDVSEYITTVMHHLIRAEQVWLTRLQGQDSSHIPLWGDRDIASLVELLRDHELRYEEYLSSLQESELDTLISYRNQTGTAYETTIREILTHVALHGHYHRGQINAALRSEHHNPVNIDYITYVRMNRDQL